MNAFQVAKQKLTSGQCNSCALKKIAVEALIHIIKKWWLGINYFGAIFWRIERFLNIVDKIDCIPCVCRAHCSTSSDLHSGSVAEWLRRSATNPRGYKRRCSNHVLVGTIHHKPTANSTVYLLNKTPPHHTTPHHITPHHTTPHHTIYTHSQVQQMCYNGWNFIQIRFRYGWGSSSYGRPLQICTFASFSALDIDEKTWSNGNIIFSFAAIQGRKKELWWKRYRAF